MSQEPGCIVSLFAIRCGKPPISATAFTAAAFVVLLVAVEARAQEIVYDNTNFPLRSPDIGPRATPADRFLAQPFSIGNHQSVSSVTIALQRLGTPSGIISIDIWNEGVAGRPGSSVGTVGSVQVRLLSSEGEFVRLDGLVSGLEPNALYFVVLDGIGAPVANIDNTYRIGLVTPSDGTNGAGKALAREKTGGWVVLDDALGPGPNGERANYLQMSVTVRDPPQPPVSAVTGIIPVLQLLLDE